MKEFKPRLSFLKQFYKSLIIIIFMGGAFYTGIIFANKTEIDDRLIDKNSVFLGTVLNKYEANAKEDLSQDIDFNLFWDVWDTIKDKYVDADGLKEKEMFYGALRGLAWSTGDPYTVFMNPVVSKEFNDDLKGTFEGIGAEIGIKGGRLTIIAPLTDMPAQKVGLRAGDKVLAIDGEDTAGISIDEAVNRIRGEKGSQVTLNIWRESFNEPQDFVITRDKIIVKSVKWEINSDNIMVIAISHFNSDTEDLFDRAVRDAVDKNPRGIILDLRNNPGGFLDTAIEVSSEWVDNDIVVLEKFSDDQQQEYLSRGRARLEDFPTVVLVNQGSASASEIVSGALKDHKKATIVGMTTFGKGSVQELANLKDGSSLKVTVAKWLTPNKVDISEDGIIPDEEVDLTIENYENDTDPQMDKATEIILNSKQ